MLARTTLALAEDTLVQDLTARLTALVRRLRDWMVQETPDLQQLEELGIRSVKDLGSAVLDGLCQLTVPPDPPATYPCAWGEPAPFQRLRPATCRTLLGPITLQRPSYLGPTCHHGVAPLDQQRALCPGSRSADAVQEQAIGYVAELGS